MWQFAGKQISTWMSKVCCKALEIKPVPHNPCSPREWFPPKSETPFQRLRHFSAKQSAMPSIIFMGKYSNNGGRRPKTDPSVNRYVVRFNAEENARFLSMFEQSGAINKAAFIKNFLFQKPFKVFVVDENTRIFINQLSSLNALYRTYGVSYDTLVKTLRENFSEKKCNAAIERLREATMRLVSVCLDIQELAKQFDHRWQQTIQDK